MNPVKNTAILAAFVATALAYNTQASDLIITTAEGPGAQNSTLANSYVEDFENISTGVNNNVSWSGVGTFDTLNVINADQYGGAGGTGHYAVEGIGAVTTTTLTLNTPSSYFGMWWSAGDPANVLNFYNSGNLVASFTTANLISLLPNSYRGNPNSQFLGQDSSENFGFINFFGDASTSWDTIVFTNNGSSGFEGDNYTSRVASWSTTEGPLPGTPVLRLKDGTYTQINSVPTDFATAPGAPAPSLVACLAFASVLLLQSFKRAKRAA